MPQARTALIPNLPDEATLSAIPGLLQILPGRLLLTDAKTA